MKRLVLCICLASSTAFAGEVEEARALFDQATEALEAGDTARGRDLLQRSLEAHRAVPTCVNLAFAHLRLGDAPEAVRVLESVLQGGCGELRDDERDAVGTELRRARAALATLIISIAGRDEAELELDGVPIGRIRRSQPESIAVGAGAHVVRAEVEDGSESRRRFDISVGEQLALELRLPEPDSTGFTEPPNPPSRRVRRWVLVTLSIVAAAGVAVAIGLASRPSGVDARFETLTSL